MIYDNKRPYVNLSPIVISKGLGGVEKKALINETANPIIAIIENINTNPVNCEYKLIIFFFFSFF
jgi:hypothetical protein